MKPGQQATPVQSPSNSLESCWSVVEKIPFPDNYWVGKKLDQDLTPDNILIFPYDRGPRPLSQGMYHPRYVLDIVTGNPGTARIGNQNHFLKEGDALLIFPHQFNRTPNEPHNPDQPGWIVITFDLNHPEQVEVLRNSPRRIRKKERELLHRLLNAYQQDESALKISALLADLLLSLREAPASPQRQIQTDPTLNERDELLGKINEYIFKHLELVSPQAGMAASLGYSESQLRQIFSRLTGTSLGAYIRKQRLAEAARLLLVSDYNITQISEKFGYSSVHAFSATFKAVHGISPKQYEKISRNNLSS